MNSSWEEFSRVEFEYVGALTCQKLKKTVTCTVKFSQLLNGKLAYEIFTDGGHNLLFHRLSGRCEQFGFVGEVDNKGSQIRVENLRPTTKYYSSSRGDSLSGFIQYPESVEILTANIEHPVKSVVIEVTNLPLYRKFKLDIDLPVGKMEIRHVPDESLIRRFASAINCAAILSEISIHFANDISVSESMQLIHELCGLLSLAQRSHVWAVKIEWFGQGKDLIKSVYQEPVFDLRCASQPLIVEEDLEEFLNIAVKKQHKLYDEWRLGEVQDFYIQAMSLNSAWSQAVGFFTALETIKDVYSNMPENKHLDRYVSRKSFANKEIADKVLKILKDNFREFDELLDESRLSTMSEAEKQERDIQIQTLKSKVGELNRPAYKTVLKKMFYTLGVTVDNKVLDQLVNLRNQIIHTGSPNYEKGPWNNPAQAHQWACRFAGLVERTMLALLEYTRAANTYDKIVTPNFTSD